MKKLTALLLATLLTFAASAQTITIPAAEGYKNSIERDSADNNVELVNDEASPGNDKLYGTNGSGVRGWYDQPSSSGHSDGANCAAGNYPLGRS